MDGAGRASSEQIERARALIELHRREAATAPPADAARLLAVVARLVDEMLGDRRSACQILQEALRADPSSPAVHEAATRMMVHSTHHHQTASLLYEVALATDLLPTRIALLLDLAAFQEIRMQSDPDAIQTYEQVLQIDPGNIEATEALLRLYLRGERWDQAAKSCSRLGHLEGDAPTRFALLMVAAFLGGEEGDGNRFELALQALGTERDSEIALALVLAATPDRLEPEEMIRILQAHADSRPDQRALLHFLTSRIQAGRLGQIRAAIASAEKALEGGLKDVVYLDWLAELYRMDARWRELVEVLKAKLKLVSKTDDLVEILMTIADVLDSHLGQPLQAIEELEAALAISPSAVHVLQTLGSLYAQTERWQDLVKMHLAEAGDCKQAGRGAQALYRCSRILEEKLGHRDAAIAHLEKALLMDPAFRPAQRMLGELYQKAERHEDLLALYQEDLRSVTETERRIGILERMAVLLETRLGDPAQARDTYRRLLELDPGHIPSLMALVRLYEAGSEHEKMLAVMRTLVEVTTEARQKSELLMRMANILHDVLGRPQEAVNHYLEALEHDPRIPEAYQRAGQLLNARKQWQTLADLYQKELTVTEEPGDRVRLYLRLGRLHEQELGQPGESKQAYEGALAIDPSYWPALHGVLRMARQVHDNPLVAQLETRLLAGLPVAPSNAPAFVRLGLLLDEMPGARDAEELFARALQSDPRNQLARILLMRLRCRQHEWDRLAELLPPFQAALVTGGGSRNLKRALELLGTSPDSGQHALVSSRLEEFLTGALNDLSSHYQALVRRLEQESEPARKAAVQFRLGALAEYGNQPDVTARSIYQSLLAREPEDPRAISALERVARRQGDDELLLDTLKRQVDVAASPQHRSIAQCNLGDLLMIQGRKDEAVEAYRSALDEDPRCRTAYDNLRGLYWERADMESLGWVLERGLDSVNQPNTLSVDLILRSDIRLAKGDWQGALTDLDRALEVKPAEPSALERVDQLLRERRDYQGLIQRLEKAAQTTRSPGLKSAIYLQIGLIFQDEFQDLKAAETYLGLSIGANPDNTKALLATARLKASLDQPTEAMVLLGRVVLRTKDEDDQLEANLHIARISRENLGDPIRARTSLRGILERRPDHLPALRMMADLARQLKDDAGREDALRRLVEKEVDPALKARYLVELSDVIGTTRGWDAPEVLDTLERAIRLAPERTDLLQRLLDFYREAGRWDAIDRVLENHLDDLPPEDRPGYLLMRGGVLSTYLGRKEEAVGVLREVVRLDPGNIEAAEMLLEDLDAGSAHTPEQIDELITLHRTKLIRSPLPLESIRVIFELAQKAHRADESYCAGDCLIALGEATEEEVYFQKLRRKKLPNRASASLPEGTLVDLALPAGDHRLRALVLALRPHLQDLIPADLAPYGLDSLTQDTLEPDHPVRQVFHYCAQLLGAGDYPVVEALGGVPRGTVEPGDPPCILVPMNFLGLPVPVQRFMAGRLLARVSLGTDCFEPGRAEPLSVKDLKILVAAIRRTAEPDFGDGLAPRAILDDVSRRVAQNLDPSLLPQVYGLAIELSSVQRDDLEGWLHSTEVGACFAGLVCCGEVTAAADALKPTARRPDVEDTLTDLMRFAVSEPFARYRRLTGLALLE